MTHTITLNEKFNSLEVSFDSKPGEAIRTALKGLGFRWNPKRSIWYGFADRAELEAALNGDNVSPVRMATNDASAVIPSLWDRCKVDDIPDHDRRSSTKDVAAQTRKHMNERFPELKISCRIGSGGWAAHNEVCFEFKSGPYAKDSIYFEYIEKYVKTWLDSFNYNNSDIMTDYFDVNFYESIDAYYYKLTAPTPAQLEDIADFDKQLELFKVQEEEQRRREAEKYAEECKVREKAAKERAEREKVMHGRVSEHVKVVDLPEADKYIMTASMICGCGKECNIDEVKENGYQKTESAEITREIYFTNQAIYDDFCKLFLYDFDFLAGFGGTGTLDNRLNNVENIYSLNEEQRESVKWIFTNSIAVFLNDEMQLVIDPEGFSYARYVNIIDSEIEKELVNVAEQREEATQREAFHFPKKYEDCINDLEAGKKYTLIYEDPWSLCSSMHYITLDDCGIKKYAQYDKALYLEYIERGKKKPTGHYFTPNSLMILYADELPPVPASLQSRHISGNVYENMTAGANVREFLKSVYKHYESLGFLPVIDTLQF